MMKHIKKHTHTFLFFLGGLFLMLVGPALIPFSSAATVANTQATDNSYNNYLISGNILYINNIKGNIIIKRDDLPEETTRISVFYYNHIEKKSIKNSFTYKEKVNGFEVSIPEYIANGNTIATLGVYNASNALTTSLRIKPVSERELAKIIESVNNVTNPSHSSPQNGDPDDTLNNAAKNAANNAANTIGNVYNYDYFNSNFLQGLSLRSAEQVLAKARVNPQFEGNSITAAVTRLEKVFVALFNGLKDDIGVMFLYNITRDYQLNLLKIENNALKEQIEQLTKALEVVAPQATQKLHLKENMEEITDQVIQNSTQMEVKADQAYLNTFEVLNLENQAKEFKKVINGKINTNTNYNKAYLQNSANTEQKKYHNGGSANNILPN